MKTPPIPFPTLLAELADPNSQVRRQAISSIRRRRNERGQAFTALLALLTDPEDLVRNAAIKALGALGNPAATPALAPMLTHHRDFRLRLLVLETLVQVNPALAIPHLITALHDQADRVRLAVVRLAKAVRLVDPLLAALGNEDWLIRCQAATALGTLGDTRAVEPLMAALADVRGEVREDVARALGILGDARAMLPLRTLLADPIPSVVQQAREALARLEGSGSD